MATVIDKSMFGLGLNGMLEIGHQVRAAGNPIQELMKDTLHKVAYDASTR
jgi:hypothetical protein